MRLTSLVFRVSVVLLSFLIGDNSIAGAHQSGCPRQPKPGCWCR